MRSINRIIVHCSATPEGRNNTIADIDKWHIQKGFAQVGYHYVIHLDGSIHKGRSERVAGAHCTGYNRQSIGICYIGGLAKDGKTAKDTRTQGQKASLLHLIKELKRKYPRATVHGHREFANKACPSFDAKLEYNNI